MRIKFGELKIGDIAKKNYNRIFETHWASGGPLVEEFESNWSQKFGYKHSITMSSGTDADINCCLALYDFGAKRGDEIICPALTFVATANSIIMAGFTPVFVDIKVETLNIDEDLIEKAITEKTRAIMLTHTMGRPCEMDKIMAIAKKYNLYVFEDACEAHGAKYNGKFVGKIGHAATFSFYTAHIVVAGEGGMVSTDHEDLAYVMRSTKSHGRKPGTIFFDFLRLGVNSKMNDLEAALGLEGLHNFDDTINKRVKNRASLMNLLYDVDDILYLPDLSRKDMFVSPHAFPLVFKKDNAVMTKKFYDYLESNSIQCKTLFSSLPTQHKAFEYMKLPLGTFPAAEYVGRNGLHFGIHQYLTEDDMFYISKIIHEFFEKE
jgi:dTDP-4-amino-4,6-dideoxygalactose transaminase